MSSTICEICCKEPQKYCCPRCNTLYCSLACYKNPKHSTCSETFYRECVINEFTQRHKDDNAAAGSSIENPDLQTIVDILKRQEFDNKVDDHSSSDEDVADSDDDDDETDNDENLSERLQGIDINDSDAVWQSLSASERKEFEKLIESNDLHSIIPSYEPWWYEIKLIEDITTSASTSSSASKNIPTIVSVIKDFVSISTKSPPKCIEYNLINILSAYTIIVRCYTGDHLQNPRETANLLISLSENLLTMANFPCESMAIDSVVNLAQQFGLLSNDDGENVHKTIEDDVKKIMSNGTTCVYVLSALSDIYRLFKAASKRDGNKLANGNGGEFTQKFLVQLPVASIDKTKLNACIRKIEFLLSYAKDILK